MLAAGHPDAWDYPIGMVADEAALVNQRVTRQIASVGIVVQSAVATSSMAATKDTGPNFQKLIQDMMAGD